MARQILVALESQDRLGQMIPYLEEIAQPGTKVVFLVRFAPNTVSRGLPHRSFEWKHVAEPRFDQELREPEYKSANVEGLEALEAHRLPAEHRVFLTLEALLKRGIEVTLDLYTGSLRSVVKSYMRKGHVDLMMKRMRWSLPMSSLLRWMFPNLSLFRQQTLSPIFLLHTTGMLS